MPYLLHFNSVDLDDVVSIADPDRLDATWELEIDFADNSGRTQGHLRLLDTASGTLTFLELNDPTGAAQSTLNVAYRVNSVQPFTGVAPETGSSGDIGDGRRHVLNIVYDGTDYLISFNGETPVVVAGTNVGFRLFNRIRMNASSVYFYRMRYWSDNTRTTLVHDYDPSASNGTGSTLTDTVSANNGTLVNFPTDDSQWVYYEGVGDPEPEVPTVSLVGVVAPNNLSILLSLNNFTTPPNKLLLTDSNSNTMIRDISYDGNDAATFSMPPLPDAGNSSAGLLFGDITLTAYVEGS